MPKTDEQTTEVQKDTRKTEQELKERRRERVAKKSESAPANERLVAPILLVITILISYLIVLFS